MKEVRERIDHFRTLQKRLDGFMKETEIRVKQIPDIYVASIRFKGIYSDVGNYFGILYRSVGRYVCDKQFGKGEKVRWRPIRNCPVQRNI